MAKLIDLEKIKPMDFPSTEMDGLDVVRYLNTLPTVDAVEVVHGQWVKYEDDRFNGYYADGRIRYRKVRTYYCDKCGYGTVVKSNYCSNCGAKMEGERNV